jgi:hypothetical protein
MLGKQVLFILTREKKDGYETRRMDELFIKQHISDFNKHFYVCGPDQMVTDLTGVLGKAGAATDSLVFEK